VKICFYVSILAAISAATVPCGFARSKESRKGTIVSIQKRGVARPAVRPGADPDRTPLQSHYYRYDVSVQLNCEVYVGRYESVLDDLPSALSPNNSVPIRLKKHVMYLDFSGDAVTMQILHHEVSHAGACGQASLANE
jgi:hypothetical protein